MDYCNKGELMIFAANSFEILPLRLMRLLPQIILIFWIAERKPVSNVLILTLYSL